MALDIYWIALLVSVPIVATVSSWDTIYRRLSNPEEEKQQPCERDVEAKAFRRRFLQVYLLVMCSEWLQGPYTYTLFRHEKHLDEHVVATLYIIFYISAAIAAPFTGVLADRFGRRAGCFAYCFIHSLASVSVLFDQFEVLVLGRVMGGIAVTLLWTSFESWMVTEHNARDLEHSAIPLSAMFSSMTTANCITAILAGVFSHCVVLALGSKTDPFIVGMAIDAAAVILMIWDWNENCTVPQKVPEELAASASTVNVDELPDPAAWRDPRIWALAYISCCFEGTIFLMMFYWPGALQRAREVANHGDAESFPYGVVFAVFMASMVLGAMAFDYMTAQQHLPSNQADMWKKVVMFLTPTRLLIAALTLSGASFLITAFATTENCLFFGFLLLEFCNGLYVPSVAFHRGKIVKDASRTSVYSLMNIPLFLFVVVALYTTNKDMHHKFVFVLNSCLLLSAAIVCILVLGDLFSGMFIRNKGFTLVDGKLNIISKEDPTEES